MPKKIVLDSSNNIYVGTSGGTNGDRLYKFDSSGNYLWYKNDYTSGTSLTFDNQGYLMIGSINGYINKYDTNGNQIYSKSLGSTYITYLCVASDGTIFVTKSASSSLTKCDISGNYVNSITLSGSTYGYSMLYKNNKIYVVTTNGFLVYNLDLTYSESISVANHNTNCYPSLDQEGNIYTSASTNTYKLSNTNNSVLWTTSSLGSADSIAVDNNGGVYAGKSPTGLRKVSNKNYKQLTGYKVI